MSRVRKSERKGEKSGEGSRALSLGDNGDEVIILDKEHVLQIQNQLIVS